MISRCIIVAMTIFLSGNAYASSEVDCLAYTLYKEANAESPKGRRAVLDVLYNRMRIRAKTACQIIKEKGQFSWYKAGMKFKLTMEMLTDFINVDNMPSVLPSTAEYFHNKGVHPAWAKRFKRVTVIGNHTFYSDRRTSVSAAVLTRFSAKV